MEDKLLQQIGRFVGQNRAEVLTLTDAKLEKAVEMIQSDMTQLQGEILRRCIEVDDAVTDRFNDKLKGLTAKHVEEIAALTEQLKAQEAFEAQLTERIAQIKDGEQGPQGVQGEDGLDRPLLEPIEIQSKGYPKSTVGTFENGLWIATKETVGDPSEDPQAWHCMLDAMSTMSIDLMEDRRFKLSVRMSSGELIDDTFDIPYPEHKGIWAEGEYKKGDIVTKGSSMWLAQEDTAGQPPGNGWQQILTAPRGKQGPAGKSIVGPQGKPGRNGMDAVLPENFIDDVMALASERKAFEDGRSGAEAITSFRGYFAPGEVYRSGDVVNFDGALYLCTSGGGFRSIAESQGSFELMLSVPKFTSPAYMLWQGQWEQKTYNGGHVVRDGDWTMVALTKTSDRAAPQAIGDPVQGYNGASPTTSASAKQVIQGARYNSAEPVWINGFRFYTVTDNFYRVFSVSANGQVNELISFVAGSTGWNDFAAGPYLVPAGANFDLFSATSEPDPTPTIFSGDWAYSTPQNPAAPSTGAITHSRSQPGVMDISATDDNAGDRYAELALLGVGDIIDDGTVRWAIQSSTDNTTYFTFGVSPATNSTEGTKKFDFETVTPTPITYLSDPDYYLSNPRVQGLLGIDTYYQDIVPDENAYGADIILQDASISPDWEMVAYSSGGAGVASPSLNQYEHDWVSASAAAVDFGLVQTTDNTWTEIDRYTPAQNSAFVASLIFEGKRDDAWGVFYAEYKVVVENDGGALSATDIEVLRHSDNLQIMVRSVVDGADVAFEVRGATGQTWNWKLVTFYNEVNP